MFLEALLLFCLVVLFFFTEVLLSGFTQSSLLKMFAAILNVQL